MPDVRCVIETFSSQTVIGFDTAGLCCSLYLLAHTDSATFRCHAMPQETCLCCDTCLLWLWGESAQGLFPKSRETGILPSEKEAIEFHHSASAQTENAELYVCEQVGQETLPSIQRVHNLASLVGCRAVTRHSDATNAVSASSCHMRCEPFGNVDIRSQAPLKGAFNNSNVLQINF